MTGRPRPNAVAAAWTVAAVSLRRLGRDRLGLFFVVVLPLLIILLFGVAGGGSRDQARVGVVGATGGPLVGQLMDDLDARDTIALVRYETRSELESAVRRRTVRAGLVVPDDYDAQISGGDTASVDLIADPSGSVPSAVRTTVAGVIALQNVRLQTAQVVSDEADVSFGDALALTDEVGGDTGLIVRTETTAATETTPEAIDRAAAGTLVLFVFLTALIGSAALIETRRLGTARRMLAAPTTSTTVVSGEALGRFLIALLQAAIVIVGASLLFGAEWHDPLAVWTVVGLLSLVGTGAAMAMGAVFSTPEQASAVALPLGIGMGMLGGCMWPRDIVAEPLQALGRITPHAWAMDALDTVLTGEAGMSDIATELVVLALFAGVVLAVAAWAFARTLRHPPPLA